MQLVNLQEYNAVRFWHLGVGHGGGKIAAPELNLIVVKGVSMNVKLDGRRKLSALSILWPKRIVKAYFEDRGWDSAQKTASFGLPVQWRWAQLS